MRSPCTTFHRVQSTAHQPNTHVVQVVLTEVQKCCAALPSHGPYVSFKLISSAPDFDVLSTATCRSHDKLHVHVNEKRVRERDGVRCTILVGSDLPHSLIDVRQNAASVKDPVLDDEQLEESLIS